jgi:MFS family permease
VTDDREPQLEDTESAVFEGVAYRPGSARAALAHRDFRLVWAGSLGSNVGSWMQNVVLGALGFRLTHSASYVALLSFAQLGPLLALSILGGLLADAVDRRLLLIAAQAEQLVCSILLAVLARGPHPSTTAIFWCVLAVGIGNAINGPVFSASIPILVGTRDLAGAVSLQAMAMNLSRVVGPAIGGVILPFIGAPGVFVVNALTYLFVIGALLMVAIPRPYPEVGVQGIRRLAAGFVVARADALVRRVLLTMFTLSLLSLPFVGLMPVIAGENLRMNPEGVAYGLLYACFGLGAAIGAMSIGTVFVAQSKRRIARVGLVCFGVALGAFGVLHAQGPAYPVVFAVGASYFATVTALSTTLQEHLDDAVRGRVMALWIMAFGGTVPLGILIAGKVATATSIGTVLVVGAIVAVALGAGTRIERSYRSARWST